MIPLASAHQIEAPLQLAHARALDAAQQFVTDAGYTLAAWRGALRDLDALVSFEREASRSRSTQSHTRTACSLSSWIPTATPHSALATALTERRDPTSIAPASSLPLAESPAGSSLFGGALSNGSQRQLQMIAAPLGRRPSQQRESGGNGAFRRWLLHCGVTYGTTAHVSSCLLTTQHRMQCKINAMAASRPKHDELAPGRPQLPPSHVPRR